MRYRVYPIPNAADEEGHAHFDVAGGDVNYYARQEELAAIMQRALNAPRGLTPKERKLVREVIGHVLADAHGYTPGEMRALERAQEKLA